MFTRVATKYTVAAILGVGLTPDRDRGSTRDGLITPTTIARNVKRERKRKNSTIRRTTNCFGSGHTLWDHGSRLTNGYARRISNVAADRELFSGNPGVRLTWTVRSGVSPHPGRRRRRYSAGPWPR